MKSEDQEWEKVKVTVVAGQVRQETHLEAVAQTDRPAVAKVGNSFTAIQLLGSRHVSDREASLFHVTGGRRLR